MRTPSSTRRPAARAASTALVLLLASACGGSDGGGGGLGLGALAPDFSLTDVNPNSATHDADLSPRDYLAGASAWYFGHAT
jgi:hypothetical protein